MRLWMKIQTKRKLQHLNIIHKQYNEDMKRLQRKAIIQYSKNVILHNARPFTFESLDNNQREYHNIKLPNYNVYNNKLQTYII